MRIGCTADLHYGIGEWEDEQVRRFIGARIATARLDLLVVAGDLAETAGGAGPGICRNHHELLTLLREAAGCPVAFCAGNHDIWTTDPNIDSLSIYRERLAAVAAATQTTYLEEQSLELDEVTLVGCYGHFDYSLRTPDLAFYGEPVTEAHYRRQTPPGYPQPVWMDGQMIRWDWDDPAACAAICGWGRARMAAALRGARNVLFASHGVPRNEVNEHVRRRNPVSLFINAFSGTARLEEIVRLAAARGARVLAISGHTHKAVKQIEIDGVAYLNIGGTYGQPQLRIVEFP